MDFFLWLVFTSNLISQTTWLKVKLKLVNFLTGSPMQIARFSGYSLETSTQYLPYL